MSRTGAVVFLVAIATATLAVGVDDVSSRPTFTKDVLPIVQEKCQKNNQLSCISANNHRLLAPKLSWGRNEFAL